MVLDYGRRNIGYIRLNSINQEISRKKKPIDKTYDWWIIFMILFVLLMLIKMIWRK
jgi:hypothetical protein